LSGAEIRQIFLCTATLEAGLLSTVNLSNKMLKVVPSGAKTSE
jgi:hypothetical protein